MKQLLRTYWWLGLLMGIVIILAIVCINCDFRKLNNHSEVKNGFEWEVPDLIRIPSNKEGNLILYGRDLIIHTAHYFGPKGKIASMSNGMNCQNCHLDAGTKLWGNNYSAVYSTYPKFRARSGTIETIYKRINDCFERSLNGKALDSNSTEMQAIYAYIKWLGSTVPKNIKPIAVGIAKISFLNREADTLKGKKVYEQKCMRCHTATGVGILNTDSTDYQYPPLWGKNSFTTAAGLYRISNFAGYARVNMPFDIKEDSTKKITDEEAWDVAAYVLSQPRPHKDYPTDWPNISLKPFDHPFGPYADSITERQHKYGPFGSFAKSK